MCACVRLVEQSPLRYALARLVVALDVDTSYRQAVTARADVCAIPAEASAVLVCALCGHRAGFVV